MSKHPLPPPQLHVERQNYSNGESVTTFIEKPSFYWGVMDEELKSLIKKIYILGTVHRHLLYCSQTLLTLYKHVLDEFFWLVLVRV